MKWHKIQVFDENEETLLSLFHEIGVPRHIAATIIYLASIDEASSKDIETATGLRQPEVSRALRALDLNHWLSCRSGRYYATGRPRRIYALAVPVREIFDYFLARSRTAYEDRCRSAEEISHLLCGVFDGKKAGDGLMIKDPPDGLGEESDEKMPPADD